MILNVKNFFHGVVHFSHLGVSYSWNKCDILDLMRDNDRDDWDSYFVVDIMEVINWTGLTSTSILRIVFNFSKIGSDKILSNYMDIEDVIIKMRNLKIKKLLDER
jgi:hypothetical protein